jgi:hypothetical protein
MAYLLIGGQGVGSSASLVKTAWKKARPACRHLRAYLVVRWGLRGWGGLYAVKPGLPGLVQGEGEVVLVVGGEEEPSPLDQAGGKAAEEGFLEEAPLLVALFGPGVGKVDDDLEDAPRGHQVLEGEGAFPQVEAGVADAFPLEPPEGPLDAGRRNLGPQDEPFGMGPGVVGGEAAIAEAHFHHQRAFPAEEGFGLWGKLGQEGGPHQHEGAF